MPMLGEALFVLLMTAPFAILIMTVVIDFMLNGKPGHSSAIYCQIALTLSLAVAVVEVGTHEGLIGNGGPILELLSNVVYDRLKQP
jgi:hypothetical protein